jgi:aminopeptidase N
MRSRRNAVLAVTLPLMLAASLLGASAGASAPSGHNGSGTAGDPYFPHQGNGGYDVGSYTIHIGYTPSSKKLVGAATIHARATRTLSRFNLDLRRNMHVKSVRVDGHTATFSSPASLVQELVIRPAHVLPYRHRFTVNVQYEGTVKAVTDADGSLDGFITTNDGAFVASEPQGSPTWFPVNDTPHDKATYRVSITVPKGLTGVSNGVLTSVHRAQTTTTWSWRLTRPVSSYLVTATIGKFDVTKGRSHGGVPYYTAIDPSQKAKATPVMAKLPAIIDYFSKVYGKYPFGWSGGIVDNAPNVGYALETATRPVFDRAPSVATLSHELAHQWYGDDVTLLRWRDIWLNEGFAEFSSWLWDEHTGVKSAAQHLRELLAQPASNTGTWNPPPANPGSAATIFSGSVYDRGAGALQALRQKLGSTVFFKIMRGWVKLHHYGNARVSGFTTYASKISHKNLHNFFYVWLYRTGKP